MFNIKQASTVHGVLLISAFLLFILSHFLPGPITEIMELRTKSAWVAAIGLGVGFFQYIITDPEDPSKNYLLYRGVQLGYVAVTIYLVTG